VTAVRLQLTQLLWDPVPDPLPPAGRGWLRSLTKTLATELALSRLSAQELVERRVRRGTVQALVRETFQRAVAEQDSEHRPPAAFTQAWRDHLAGLLGQASIDLDGHGQVEIADLDTVLAWSLFEAASRARQNSVEQARPGRSRRVQWGDLLVQTFEFAIASGGATLGQVRYGICPPCHAGLLYKISIDPEFQFCGLGRQSLSQLETRHPDLTWYTTGQFRHARGFYDRYRQHSPSPWTSQQHPCPHFS
jgi:hypothetical protein